MSSKNLMDDGKRQMKICNACRYCEGYCAVWRAIEWRRDFTDNDMSYLANLCHDCGDCYHACPFSVPHEFGLNPPKLFSGLREETYKKYAWPNAWSKAFGEKLGGFWIAFIIGMALLLIIALATGGFSGFVERHLGERAFYQVIPEVLLIVVFGVLGLWMAGCWVSGARRFWLDIKSPQSQKVRGQDIITATKSALSLRYLGGDGGDCSSKTKEMPRSRRFLHHFVSYGFLLDFVSTTLGAIYSHILHVPAPYPFLHPVVIFGVLGGIGIIIGTSGLLFLKFRRDDALTDPKANKSGISFLIALLVVAVTGMVLLGLRETSAMSVLLVIHLGSVAALFFTAPYTKFAHFVYRYLSLVRYAQEERVAAETSQPNPIKKKTSISH